MDYFNRLTFAFPHRVALVNPRISYARVLPQPIAPHASDISRAPQNIMM